MLEMHNLRGFYDVRHHTADTQGKHIIHVLHVHIIPSVSSVRLKTADSDPSKCHAENYIEPHRRQCYDKIK